MSTRVLALHAVTRDRHDFPDLAGALPKCALEGVDLLGHGDAPRTMAYTVNAYADALEVGAHTPILYGHSLGGLVAVAYAARHPDRVGALVLEDPPLFESRMPRLARSTFYRGFKSLREMMAGEASDYGVSEWRKAVANWPSGHGRTSMLEAVGEAAVERRARQLAAFDTVALDALIEGTLHRNFSVEAALRAVRCPMVLVAGERGRGSALSETDLLQLAGEFGVLIDRVAGEGHFVHEALPGPCAAAVNRALSLI